MKTATGYETNGDYIKWRSGYTKLWCIETANEIKHFKTEDEADAYIITTVIGCEKAYPICKHWKVEEQGCSYCEYGINMNVASSDHLHKKPQPK